MQRAHEVSQYSTLKHLMMNLPLWLPQPGVSSKSRVSAPNTPEVRCLNALLQVHGTLQIKAKRSQARILCLGDGGVRLHGLFRMMIFFSSTAHTHTQKEPLIQLGPIFQKIKNAKLLKKALCIHPQSELVLTALLVQTLYGAYSSVTSSAHWSYSNNMGIIWYINIVPVDFNRKHKALIRK